MHPSNPRYYLPLIIAIAIIAFITVIPAGADITLTYHPALQSDGSYVTKQLGNFGEDFVGAGLRARGFEVIDGNIGDKGIDRIAVKRAPNGELKDIRVVEVKTRQGLPEFKLAVTEDGRQLSVGWTKPRIERIISEHPDTNVRRLAREVQEHMKYRPEIVRRELHGIAVESNKYVVMSIDDAGHIKGVDAELRLTTLLKKLSTRGITKETRTAALRHLSQFDQLKSAVVRTQSDPISITKAGIHGLEGISKQTKLPTSHGSTESKQMIIVEDGKAAKNWAKKLAKQPGMLATGITFAVDEAFTGWEYYNGNINSADLHRRTVQNGVKATAVGIATQLVYLMAPTPHGLVLIGVGIVAYIAADQAIAAYDAIFVPKAFTADELEGIIPAACIATPMLDDVATGRRRP